VLAFAMLATAAGYGVDRGRYVAANEAILNKLPTYPGASRRSTRTLAYYQGEAAWSPVAGYTTLAFFRLPRGADPDDVAAFYERRLAGEWRLVEKITEPPFAAGPILSFRRGRAGLAMNLESWRGGVLEIAVDAGVGDR
jgi:hypothetical protein